jgi:hypothetical protein
MAEEIWQHFESNQKVDDFKSILGREYGPRTGPNCSPTHDSLVKLPFKAFVTTNYDDCLTCALGDWRTGQGLKHLPGIATDIKLNGDARHMLSAFLRSLSAPFNQNERHVVHLHGRHDDPSSMILTFSQYYRAYGFETRDGQRTNELPRTTIHRQLAWALLATRKLVFFGCSMDDPYITEMLRIVSTDLWEAWQPIHFVVLPLDQESVASASADVEAFRQYGLEVVFYDNWDGTFIKLGHLLELANAQNSSVETTLSLSPPSEPLPHSRPPLAEDPTKISANQTSQTETIPLSWLDEVNVSTSKDFKKNEN